MRLVLVGDVMLGRLVNESLKSAPPAFPWGDTLPLFLQSDVRICNLECALTDRGEPWSETPKTFHFRTDAKNVAVLQAAKIDVVSLANNHTLDYGYEALEDTCRVLDEAGILHAGAGRNLAEAAEPARLDRGGVRFTMVAFTDNQPEWGATPERPGLYHVPADPEDPRFRALLAQVDQLRPTCEILVVAAHWGPNWGRRPADGHVPCAHALIEHGVDVVFGHSCHVVQGIETLRGRPVLYSTGDFVDDYAADPDERNDQSFLFLVDTDIGPWHLSLYPVVIERCHAGLAHGAEAQAIADRMLDLCREFAVPALWDPRSLCLRIALPPPPPPPDPLTVRNRWE